MFSANLKHYLFAIVVPAMVITAAGLYFLFLLNKHDAARIAESRLTRIENVAAEFQDALREAGSAAEVRFAAVKKFAAEGGAGFAAQSAYEWRPQNGVVESWRPEDAMVRRLSGFSRWNEWTSEGKKSARRGVMVVGMPERRWLLWCRLDGAVYALACGKVPFAEPEPSLLWPIGLCLVLLTAGVLCSGGVMLWRAAEKARRADTMKTTFVSNVSHELKTPLTAIQLWTGLLENGTVKTEESKRRAYSILSAETGRLLRMVDNLLDFTRLEQGRRKYRIEPVDVGELLAGAAQLSVAAYPGFPVETEVGGCVMAAADADALRQIVQNLLENARKYASSGGGALLCAKCCETEVQVQVLDRGPGMSEEECRCAFARFYRGDSAQLSGVGGQGLGLAISRALALDMGGDLGVARRDGGGCAFTLTLPACSTRRGQG